MGGGNGFGNVEGCCTGRDSLTRERRLCILRNGFERQRVRQSFPRRVLFKRIVNALVGFDDRDDGVIVLRHGRVQFCDAILQWQELRRLGRAILICSRNTQGDPVRMGKARRMALPFTESRQVVGASKHKKAVVSD